MGFGDQIQALALSDGAITPAWFPLFLGPACDTDRTHCLWELLPTFLLDLIPFLSFLPGSGWLGH